MRKIIIIVLVLLVVAGGGAGGLGMLGVVRNPFKPPPPVHVPDAVERAAAEADARAKANAFHAPQAALSLVKAGDILVPVISTDGSKREVFVTARLVAVPADKALVTDQVPRFIDAVLSDLIPYFQDYFQNHDLVDLPAVKKKLVRHAHDIYGNSVTDVLLVNVFEAGTGTNANDFPVGSD
jgi:hypothetical protein